MPHYSILEVTPRNDGWVQDYLPAANMLVSRHGGRYLARTASHETLEGVAKDVALRIVIEWPSAEAAKAFENDPDYAPHLDARLSNATCEHVLVAGKDDLA